MLNTRTRKKYSHQRKRIIVHGNIFVPFGNHGIWASQPTLDRSSPGGNRKRRRNHGHRVSPDYPNLVKGPKSLCDYLDTQTVKIGGRLQAFAQVRAQRISDAWALETVSQGYALEFVWKPKDRFLPIQKNPSQEKHRLIMGAIQHLLDMEAIKPVPLSSWGTGMYSMFFIVPPKNGDVQAILDLKWLNKFIQKKRFKMETLRSILETIQKGS